MDQAQQDAFNEIVNKDTWTAQDRDELVERLAGARDATGMLRDALVKLEAAHPEPKGSGALKIGIARFMLCRFHRALDVLASATDNKDRHWFQAQCFKNLHQYDKADEEFERAEARGWDADEVALERIELMVLQGRGDEARSALDAKAGKLGETARFEYVRGMLHELSGEGPQAVSCYEQAEDSDEGCPAATFRLAYYYDLHGDEDAAMELYKECIAAPPVLANALINLAVLYEDKGDYDAAIACLRRVLATDPNHLRARLFLRDAEASKTMYYDEDQARRIAKRNAVLDIPVTDFELSVRARNCLKKMNIRTLGDLVKITESELLGYKNFGETSLKEIKDMLAAKGLRLGQALEEDSDLAMTHPELPQPKPAGADEGLLATPVEQVEFSVRARRALDTLGLRTLGDVAARSEAELLACKNFGQTSLNEIRQRLNEYGLDLRESK